MNTLILFAMLFAATGQSLSGRQFGKYYPGEPNRSSSVYSVVYGIVIALLSLAIAGFAMPVSSVTLIIGVCNGVVLTVYNQFFLKSTSLGPYSIVMMVMLSFGIVLPMFWEILVYKKTLVPLEWFAVGMLIVSFCILYWPKKEEKFTLRFLLSCLVLGLVNGTYGVLYNTQQQITEGRENTAMLFFTFLTSAVLSLCILLFTKGNSYTLRSDFTMTKKSALWALAAALFATANMNLMMVALAWNPATVVYSVSGGGVLLLSVLIAMIFFKEKSSYMKWIGIVLVTASVLILSL